MNALEEHLAALTARFAGRAAKDRSELAQAVERRDRALVRDVAHKLAGLAGMLGYPKVTEAALVLETAAEEGRDLDDAATALDIELAAVIEGPASSS